MIPSLDLAGRAGDDAPSGLVADLRDQGAKARRQRCRLLLQRLQQPAQRRARQDVERIAAGHLRAERSELLLDLANQAQDPSIGALPGSPAISCWIGWKWAVTNAPGDTSRTPMASWSGFTTLSSPA